MKSKQRSENPKQTSTEDLQSPVWKQQELNLDLTVNSQENTKLEKVGQTLTDRNRLGDLAEYYAVTWLWDEGYEVFKNAGCSGLIDLIAYNKETEDILLIDVKTVQEDNRRGAAPSVKNTLTKQQREKGVRVLSFNPWTRKLKFVKHRDSNENN